MTNQQPPNTPFALNCARAQDIIFDLLESAASGAAPISHDVRATLDQHLADCGACRDYQHTMQNLHRSLSEIDDFPVPSGLEDRIMAAVDQNSAPRNGSSRLALLGAQGKRYAPLAAALLVIAVSVPLIMQLSMPRHNPASGPQVAQGMHGQPNTRTSVSTRPTAPTELANLPNAPQATESGPSNGPQPEASVSQPAIHMDTRTTHTHPTARALAPVSNSQPINGQQLAYNPDGQDSFPSPDTSTGNQQIIEPDAGQPNGALAVDPSSLASAIPQSASEHFSNIGASNDETDVYYDPVSNLVGF